MAGSKQINHDLDLLGISRINNLPDAVSAQQPVTLAQLDAQAKGLSWKDNARVAPDSNVNISSPGAALDSITLTAGDRVLLRNQTTLSANGIYVWTSSAVPLTRSNDANTFDSMESAIVCIDEGTNAGTLWRQSAVNGSLGVDPISFVTFTASVPNASTTTSGAIEIATQTEVDAGTDTIRAVTPSGLANYVNRPKKYIQVFGDASAVSYVISHNLNSRDILTTVRQTGTPYKEISLDIAATTVNSVTVSMNIAPGVNGYTITIHAV